MDFDNLENKNKGDVFSFPKYEDLSCEQKDAINLNFTSSHLVVGGPGTGKTIVALYRMHRLYELNNSNKNVIIVFNRPLMKYIKAVRKHMQWDNEFEVYTEYEWLYNVLYNGSETKSHTNGVVAKFVPKISEYEFDWEKINQDFENKKIYDNVIIDEGQDFPIGFYKLLMNVAEYSTVFADPNQSLQNNKSNLVDIMNTLDCSVRYTLTLNYRNSREITNFSRNYCYDKTVFAESYNQDDSDSDVKLLPLFKSNDELCKTICDIVKKYTPNDEIGIIVPNVKGTEEEKRKHSFDIYNYLKANLDPSYKVSVYYNEEYKYDGAYDDKNNVDFNEKSIKIFNYLTVRGLDFDATIILDEISSRMYEKGIEESDLITSLNKLYVAITRTKKDLYMIPMNDKVREVFDELPEVIDVLRFPQIDNCDKEALYKNAKKAFDNNEMTLALYYVHYLLAIVGVFDDEVLYVNALKLFANICDKIGKNDFAVSMLLNYQNKRGLETNKDIDKIYETLLSRYKENIADSGKEAKYDVVSKMAYLLGLSKEKYKENNYDVSIFNELENDRNAKGIRTLCELRGLCLAKAKSIVDKLKSHEATAIYAMNDIFPHKMFTNLNDCNIKIPDADYKNLETFEIALNKCIVERVGNILQLFGGINHDYIKNLFIMPNGTDYQSLKNEVGKYYENISLYPFGLYINWTPKKIGNLLKDDLTFAWNLYDMNGERFVDYGSVVDVSEQTKKSFHNFVSDSNKILIIVDCENSDPYQLVTALNGLGEEYTSKIYKMMLVDDSHTTCSWQDLEEYTNIPIEYEEIERISEGKSLVDHALILRAAKEMYKNDVDAVIIVSSDSDYSELVKGTEEDNIKFFFMLQSNETSKSFIDFLNEKGIKHCFIDYFYTRNNSIKEKFFVRELNKTMNDKLSCNINDLMKTILISLRMKLSEQDKKEFINKYVCKMKFDITDDVLSVKVGK